MSFPSGPSTQTPCSALSLASVSAMRRRSIAARRRSDPTSEAVYRLPRGGKAWVRLFGLGPAYSDPRVGLQRRIEGIGGLHLVQNQLAAALHFLSLIHISE